MKLLIIGIQLLFLSTIGLSFDWDAVTEHDWNFKLPESVKTKYAAVLFEKIYIDDTKLSKNRCTYSIYKRIRIFQNEGRALADVQVPMIEYGSEIEELEGRVILRDGTIIELNSDHIFSKYILEYDDEEVEQTFFYLPGVTSDCIIEYYIEYELSLSYHVWEFEKDIYLKYGELIWEFHKGDVFSSGLYGLLLNGLFPNYVVLNSSKQLDIENILDEEIIDKVVFSTDSVKPFEQEDYTVGPSALKGQLICFYTGGSHSEEYWISQSNLLKNIEDSDTISQEKIAELKSLAPNTRDKQKLIDFAYKWVKENITNIDFISSDANLLSSANLDSLINKGYGTSIQINNLYYHILKILGIKAYPVYCLSRYKNIFHPSAKYWQFDHRITAVKKSTTEYEFYDLSDKNIPKGSVNYDYENTYGFIVGDLPWTEVYIPPSDCKKNTILFYDNVTINDDLTIKSSFARKYTGHFATDINYVLDILNETNNDISCLYEDDPAIISIDTVCIKDRDVDDVFLEGVSYLGSYLFNSGNFIVFRPFNYVDVYEDIGYKKERIHPIQIEYPYNQKHIIQIHLPQNVDIYKCPGELKFENEIGQCAASFSKLNDRQLSVSYSFTLKNAFLRKDQYEDLLKLFEVRREMLSKLVLLTKKQSMENEANKY